MRELALFAGAGGGLYASILLGWHTVAAVEIDQYARSVLRARQGDGTFERFAIYRDVRAVDSGDQREWATGDELEPREWRGRVDVVTGGFPCQDISVAGRGAGLDGARSGIWSEYRRIVEEVEPAFVFAENSPYLASRGLDRILLDVAALGFDAEWTTLSAEQVGAPHRRDRLWILAAHPDRVQLREHQQRATAGRIRVPHEGQALASVDGKTRGTVGAAAAAHGVTEDRPWWSAEPGVARVVHGLAHRGDRERALGNGQVPLVAAVAARELARRLGVDIG
jgi:DNA (cytosine-5)-methyltransferase 1